jgi:hypothetical protein
MMTVTSQTREMVGAGNGVTTVFAYSFMILTANDATVALRDNVTLIETPLNPAQYTLTGIGLGSGTLTYTPAIPTGTSIVLRRILAYTQDLDITTQSAFDPNVVELQLDRQVMMLQQLAQGSDNAVALCLGYANSAAASAALAASYVPAGQAPLASPVFTGDPRAPTPATADNDTSIATTAYVQANITALKGGAPAPLDTLGELATAITTGLGKQTIWIPAPAMTPRVTNGPASGTVETATNFVMIKTLDFDSTTAEFAQFAIRMPKSWNEGTMSAIFVWSHAATTVNFGVVWGIQALAISDNDPTDAAFGTIVKVTDTGGTTNNSYQSPETAAMTASGSPQVGDMVIFQVSRAPADATDTMAIDARLRGVVLFYTIDTLTDT